ncbi:MAG: hypothetical protein JWP37_495, partial [Mucilaginibacter sp.]|nr:hypothetical protein [Mucilaginibacter sp.]
MLNIKSVFLFLSLFSVVCPATTKQQQDSTY